MTDHEVCIQIPCLRRAILGLYKFQFFQGTYTCPLCMAIWGKFRIIIVNKFYYKKFENKNM